MLLDRLTEKYARYRDDCLLRMQVVVQSQKDNLIKIWNQEFINFTSNDYLNIARDNRVKKSLAEAAENYGLGSSSSAVVSGYSKPHQLLEQKFAEFLNRDKTILFNSGYHANLGVICSLANRNSNIIADKLCHASIIDSIRLSGASYARYKHNDINHAESLLQETDRNCLLITEGIFSMEGDITPADKLAEKCSQYEAVLAIDDAHSIGVLGENGRGICEYYNLTQQKVPVLIIPLGKAFGSMGAIVAGNENLINSIRQFARSYVYSTALPPAIVSATLKAVEIIEQESWRRQRLLELIYFFVEHASKIGLCLVSNDLTPIKSIIIGKNSDTVEVQNKLKDKGFLVSCIRPPTVPVNTARIRISLNCAHSKQQIITLLESLLEIMETI